MSQDLFAAFADPRPEHQARQSGEWTISGATGVDNDTGPREIDGTASSNDFGDDEWGDFEDASALGISRDPLGQEESVSASKSVVQQRGSSPSNIRPKAQRREDLSPSKADSKIGKHPFAGHMDFLFEAGEDEYDAGADDLDNLANNPEAAMAYSKRIIAEQEAQSNQQPIPMATQSSDQNPQSRMSAKTEFPSQVQSQSQSKLAGNPSPARKKLQTQSDHATTKDPRVLFDADNLSESDEDDWGDFEEGSTGLATNATGATEKSAVQHPDIPIVDLLGLGDVPESLGEVGRFKTASDITTNANLGSSADYTPAKSHITILPADDSPWASFEESKASVQSHKDASHNNIIPTTSSTAQDDSWGDFDDFDTTEAVPNTAQSSTSSKSRGNIPAKQISTNHSRNTSIAAPESILPPTNIPPPVLLLSVFPSLFGSAQDNLFLPLSKLDASQRHQLLSHAATHQFLRNYLNQALVLAHIVAGRKLRWKRDQILSQSMRIGPAAAGGKGGMKLTGIDKSELAKEDREVLDVVRLWKAQAGKLRGALTGAKLPPVPDISEQMPVKALKAVEGGFVAPHACALCGLKREERVAKVDVDVDDSFGEWWVNGMDMHLTCKNWWDENKRKLQSR